MPEHPTHAFGRRGLALLAAAAFGGGAGMAGAYLATGQAAAAGQAAEPGFDPGGDLVARWSLAAYQAIKAKDGYRDPLAASRILAMMHLAMHDAVNAAAPRFATHLPLSAVQGADPAVAASAAAHGVLRALCPGQREALAFEAEKTMLEAGRGEAVARGRLLGETVAATMLVSRAGDGADRVERYGPMNHVGAYRYTPGYDFLFAPQWRSVRPFALLRPAQFRTAPPTSVESAAYARAFAEVKRIGGKDSADRTEDQTHAAHFWYEFSDIGWNRVARVAAREHALDLWDAARLFALVNMALADGYIAGWDSKIHHDFWRPVTAIRMAAQDFNPETSPDPAWEPLLPTPPVQDHPSTHATLGAAAAAVMAELLGDATPFALASTTALPENPVRRFQGFAAAARENAESRIAAGLHFRFACDAGLELGRRIGRYAVANHLRPVE
ncbi:vanadium-dependent haloperoxidase [Falsiroseomonas bella]|nr:vanadium-dependent haloperoxidase [Falsiroseomonas bella]